MCEQRGIHIRLLLHTRVRWLSIGTVWNRLERYVNLYDAIRESSESKALISYLADIFGRTNALNKDLQSKEMTLMGCKTEIFGFVNKLKYFSAQIARQNFSGFTPLGRSEPTDNTLQIILKHLSNVVVELNSRFSDLKLMKFASWIVQPFLFN